MSTGEHIAVEDSPKAEKIEAFELVDQATKYTRICEEFTTCANAVCDAVSRLSCFAQIAVILQLTTCFLKDRSNTYRVLICKLFDAMVGHVQSIDPTSHEYNDEVCRMDEAIRKTLTEKQQQMLTRAEIDFSVRYIKFVQLDATTAILKYKSYVQTGEFAICTVIIADANTIDAGAVNGTIVTELSFITIDNIVRSKLSNELQRMLKFHEITREEGCRCLSVEESPVKGYNVKYVQTDIFSETFLYSVDITETELKIISKKLV
jgi:hypothetical protein